MAAAAAAGARSESTHLLADDREKFKKFATDFKEAWKKYLVDEPTSPFAIFTSAAADIMTTLGIAAGDALIAKIGGTTAVGLLAGGVGCAEVHHGIMNARRNIDRLKEKQKNACHVVMLITGLTIVQQNELCDTIANWLTFRFQFFIRFFKREGITALAYFFAKRLVNEILPRIPIGSTDEGLAAAHDERAHIYWVAEGIGDLLYRTFISNPTIRHEKPNKIMNAIYEMLLNNIIPQIGDASLDDAVAQQAFEFRDSSLEKYGSGSWSISGILRNSPALCYKDRAWHCCVAGGTARIQCGCFTETVDQAELYPPQLLIDLPVISMTSAIARGDFQEMTAKSLKAAKYRRLLSCQSHVSADTVIQATIEKMAPSSLISPTGAAKGGGVVLPASPAVAKATDGEGARGAAGSPPPTSKPKDGGLASPLMNPLSAESFGPPGASPTPEGIGLATPMMTAGPSKPPINPHEQAFALIYGKR